MRSSQHCHRGKDRYMVRRLIRYLNFLTCIPTTTVQHKYFPNCTPQRRNTSVHKSTLFMKRTQTLLYNTNSAPENGHILEHVDLYIVDAERSSCWALPPQIVTLTLTPTFHPMPTNQSLNLHRQATLTSMILQQSPPFAGQ